MARYEQHPASELKVGREDVYKDRRASYEDIKQAQQVKKLRKKRKKGR